MIYAKGSNTTIQNIQSKNISAVGRIRTYAPRGKLISSQSPNHSATTAPVGVWAKLVVTHAGSSSK